MSPKKTKWSNWAKTEEIQPVTIKYPVTSEEIVAIVHGAKNEHKQIRVAGSGHSFTGVVPSKDILISLKDYSGLISVNDELKQATFKAGTTLKDAAIVLDQHGLGFSNMGDIDVQTLAGAYSTGTHGSGILNQTLPNHIVSMKIITSNSQILLLDNPSNLKFKAAQVMIGALGIIIELTIQLETQYKLKMVSKKEKLDVCLENLEKYIHENRSFEFFWFPYTSTVQLKLANKTEEEIKHNRFTSYFNDIIMENKVWGVVCKFTKWFPRSAKYVSKLAGALISEGTKINLSHKIYVTPRLVRFTEMEYAMPMEQVQDVILALKRYIEHEKIQVQFPVEVRFVKSDDIFLSPAYQQDSCYIAVHLYQGMNFEKYFKGCEQIFLQYGGRPHWGKIHYLTAKELAPKYPKWDSFQIIRREMDPEGIFMNDHLGLIFND